MRVYPGTRIAQLHKYPEGFSWTKPFYEKYHLVFASHPSVPVFHYVNGMAPGESARLWMKYLIDKSGSKWLHRGKGAVRLIMKGDVSSMCSYARQMVRR